MTITIYLTGQNNFGNRGCEALVRSTVATLRNVLGDTRFLVPSLDIPRDSAQWPEAEASGVTFVPSPQVPASYRWWGRACRHMPFLKATKWPSLRGLPNLEEYLQQADAVISIGGDNYSLDYGLVSLFFFVGIAERASEIGRAQALWGASVGPFAAEPLVERYMIKHLEGLDLVTVRESHSANYLRSIGVTKNLASVVDSAFVLERQFVDVATFWPQDVGQGVLGINVSEMMQISIEKQGIHASVIAETASFIERVLHETSYSVLLVPHVAPLDGNRFNNDEVFLEEVFCRIENAGHRVSIVPSRLNCCQLKDIIARCRFFIGGRTHATIAALSSMVPTISIAYSIKARGINLDLFGHEQLVLPTTSFSCSTLFHALGVLVAAEGDIRACLQTQIPVWKAQAHRSAELFSRCMDDRKNGVNLPYAPAGAI